MREFEVNKTCEEYVNWIIKRKGLDINDNFVLSNLSLFYIMTVKLVNCLKECSFKKNIESSNHFSKMDFMGKVITAKDFFKQINLNVDVEECIKDGTIEPFMINFSKNNMKRYLNGHGQINSNGTGEVVFPNSGLVLDLVIMNHELGHYANKPNDKEGVSILSEAVALYTELQTYDYLFSLEYEIEADFFKNLRISWTYKDAIRYSNLISILLTYLTYGSVTKENFERLIKDKDYYNTLNSIEKKDDFFSLSIIMNYILGILLASYMYEKVKDDFSFTENIRGTRKIIFSI